MNSLAPALKVLCREGMKQDEPVKMAKALKEIDRDSKRYGWTDDRIESMPTEWQWRVCTARLQLGYLDWRGWQWRNPRGGHDPFDIPKWDLGLPIYPVEAECREPERAERLLIYSEQGVGDQLMFAQALGEVRSWCREVCIEVEPRLAPIFQRAFPDFMIHPLKDIRDSSWVEPGYFTAKVLMGDVAARFLRKKPFPEFVMRADNEKVEQYRHYRGETAFSFHGRQGHLDTDMFPNGWINLQYDLPVEDRFFTPPINLREDLEDVFGILANCKKVVTVPNTLAHMAGVLGIPTDVICTPGAGEVNNAANYRWGMPEDSSTPWHPSITIYRNEKQWMSRQ